MLCAWCGVTGETIYCTGPYLGRLQVITIPSPANLHTVRLFEHVSFSLEPGTKTDTDRGKIEEEHLHYLLLTNDLVESFSILWRMVKSSGFTRPLPNPEPWKLKSQNHYGKMIEITLLSTHRLNSLFFFGFKLVINNLIIVVRQTDIRSVSFDLTGWVYTAITFKCRNGLYIYDGTH